MEVKTLLTNLELQQSIDVTMDYILQYL